MSLPVLWPTSGNQLETFPRTELVDIFIGVKKKSHLKHLERVDTFKKRTYDLKVWTFCPSHSIISSQPLEACVVPQLLAALLENHPISLFSSIHLGLICSESCRMAGANPSSQWGGGGAQLGQIAGSSRDVNKQATSTDINLYLAVVGEEVKGIDRKVPSRKSVATLQRRSLNWELNPWPSCWANIQSTPPVDHILVVLAR